MQGESANAKQEFWKSAGSLWKLLESPYVLEMGFYSHIHIMKFCFFPYPYSLDKEMNFNMQALMRELEVSTDRLTSPFIGLCVLSCCR